MADDIKRFEPSSVPMGIILAHLKHIPAAMTEAYLPYLQSEHLAEKREVLRQKKKPQ